jgi:Lysylphosphatidylglycerol synthase TM region
MRSPSSRVRGRGRPDRQQTLAATLDWSHDLLLDDERVAFRRLAVFAGGFDSRLVDKSLVTAETTGEASRFRMLEVVRQYAEAQLRDAGELPACVARHRAWYAQEAASHDPDRGVPVVLEPPPWFDVEMDNRRVRAGLRVASRLLGRSWSTRPDGNPSQVDFVEPVRLGGVAGMVAFSVAIANWVFDGAALALSLVALGVAVPLCALLLVYAVGQLGSSVPFLPGALGVAEGSLTLTLVCVGVRPADAVAAALTYRVISFWLQLPVGWVVWMELRRRSTLSAPDEAALVPA